MWTRPVSTTRFRRPFAIGRDGDGERRLTQWIIRLLATALSVSVVGALSQIHGNAALAVGFACLAALGAVAEILWRSGGQLMPVFERLDARIPRTDADARIPENRSTA